MTKQTTNRLLLFYNILLIVSIIAVGILLILSCLYIYFSGNGYSRELIADTFSKISIPVYLCVVLIIGSVFIKSSSKPKFKKPKNFNQNKESCISSKNALIIKISIVVVAITSLIFGVLTGGLNDVLTKAVNICTECIGLG